MPQSNVIFFYGFAAFFVFITMRGELPKYMGFLLSSPSQASGVTRGADLPDISGKPNFSKAASIAQTAAMFIG